MESNRKNRQVLIGLLVVVAAIVCLIQFSLSTSEIYSLGPSELLESSHDFLGREVRLTGIVVEDSVKKDLANTRLDFVVAERDGVREEGFLSEDAKKIEVTYIGTVVPDAFNDGTEVVVEGSFDGSRFRATHIMTKCPSKYDAATEGEKGYGKPDSGAASPNATEEGKQVATL